MLPDIIRNIFFRIKWSYTRIPVFYIVIALAFVVKFNISIQSIFYNSIYQVLYPLVAEPLEFELPVRFNDQYWQPLKYSKNTEFTKKIKFYGDIDNHSLSAYSNLSIAYPKLLSYYACTSNPSFTYILGNSIYPISHQWFDKRNYTINSSLIENYKTMDTVIAVPFSKGVTPLFYVMNIFSLLFCLNDTMIHEYPIVLAKRFEYFDEVIDLLKFNDLNIQISNCSDDVNWSYVIYANKAFLVSVPDPYEVAYEPIQKMVDIMKPQVIEYAKNNKNSYKPIIISAKGDRRIIGKKALYKHINNTFEGQVDHLTSDNSAFIDLASRFINAKIAISFSSDEMSLIPFMKPGSIYIEIQDSRAVFHNVLMAQSFGIDVRVISITDFNVSSTVMKNVTRIIKKHLRENSD